MTAFLWKTLSFFLIMAIGFFLRHAGIFSSEAYDTVTKICIYITLPAAVVTGFSVSFIKESYFMIIAISFALNWLLIGIGYLASRKRPGAEKAAYCLSLTGYNIGSFAMPLTQSFLGGEATAIICLFDLGNAFMTLGGNCAVASCLVGETDQRDLLKTVMNKLVKSPALLMEILMVILAAFHLSVSQTVIAVLTPIANANVLIGMLMIGMMLDLRLNRKQVRDILQIAGIRAGSSVLIAAVLYYLLPFEPEIKKIIVLACFAPISVLSPVYVAKCRGDAALASCVYSLYIPVSIIMMLVMIRTMIYA